MKAIITVGVSASGKTTWAKRYAMAHNAFISNRDDLRFTLTGTEGWHEYRFCKVTEKLVTALQLQTLAHNAQKSQFDVIIADTNLNAGKRDGLVAVCKGLGYEVTIKPFPVSLMTAVNRDALRSIGSRVGRTVIEQQYKQWLEYYGEEAI